jgi:uncharacterized protein (DUF983 family)
MSTGHMRYVICPNCGDAVAGRLPAGSEERKLRCAHCRQEFHFSDADIKSGLVTYDRGRWKVPR